MKNYFRSSIKLLSALVIIALLNGCYATTHTVGNGGKYDGTNAKNYDVKKKKWYLFAGLIPLDDVNANQVKGDAVNYTVREVQSPGDIAIGVLTWGIATPKTIRVSKAEE